MAVITLDAKTALIVIDLQKGIVARATVQPAGQVVKHASALAAAFRGYRLPVVLVTAGGAPSGRTEHVRSVAQLPVGWADLVPELNQQPEDHMVTKRQWGAFTNTGLGDHLKNLGVTQVVIAGIATSKGVESTARHAHELGFNVTLAVDAITDTNADAHGNCITRIFPMLGKTGTAQAIIALLDNTRASGCIRAP